MKKLLTFVVLALVVALAVPAYAETQNVKVSGSIDAYWFYRSHYNLSKDNAGMDNVWAARNTNGDNWFQSTTQIEVSADLTDNVSTVVNLVNERDWNNVTGGSGGGANADQFDIELDLAYVQMKEIFYSPLTITVGRQDLWWGRGFVLGNNTAAWDHNGQISAQEYSAQTAFDAIRATLDFNPWTIDMIYAKIDEGSTNIQDDHDIYGVNVSYKFAEYNAVAEGYLLVDWDMTNHNSAYNRKTSHTETLGGRVQFDPITQITLGGEMAYQWGNYCQILDASNANKNVGAWAMDVFGTYRWDLTWKPDLTIEYVFFSGESDLKNNNNDYHAWSRLARGRYYTAYEDFRGWVYGTAQAGDQDASQNSQMIQVKGNMKPLDDLLLTGSYSYFWAPEDTYTTIPTNQGLLGDSIGHELDFQVTYDYTEDVSFGLLTAWFIPGDMFTAPNDKNATDVVASAKVTF